MIQSCVARASLRCHHNLLEPAARPFTWRLFWATVVGAFVFEVLPLPAGLWKYSDPQALWIWRGGMPIFWVVANAVSVMVPLTLIKVFLPDLTGWRQLMVIPLSPMGAIMGHVGTGFPFISLPIPMSAIG